MKPLPLGVSATSLDHPTRRPDQLPWGSVPFNGIPRASPMWSRLPRPPRFRSQVFSTSQRFPSRPEFRGLVSCRNRSWDSPFRVFPSQESRAPLEAALLPCGYPPTCLTPPPGPCHRRFPRLPRVDAVAWFPPTTMDSLFTRRSTLPGRPGPKRRNSPVPPASPTSKP